MTDRVRRTALGIALLLALSVVSVPPVEAAAPQLLMVYGGGLTEPVILGDWDENLEFLLATSGSIDVPMTELAGRPFHALALFWGGAWSRYMAEGGSLATLRPEQANQQGRFYPAYGTRKAVLALDSAGGFGGFARRADPHAAEILLRHGISAGPIAAPVGTGLALGALVALPPR